MNRWMYKMNRWMYEVNRWMCEMNRWMYEMNKWMCEMNRWMYEMNRWMYEMNRWMCEMNRWNYFIHIRNIIWDLDLFKNNFYVLPSGKSIQMKITLFNRACMCVWSGIHTRDSGFYSRWWWTWFSLASTLKFLTQSWEVIYSFSYMP